MFPNNLFSSHSLGFRNNQPIFWALVLIPLLLTWGCTIDSGPEKAAHSAFDQFAQQQGIPYKDVKVQVLENDGTFSTVQVTVWFRPSAQADWEEKYANIEVRNVGGQWQASSYMVFRDTSAEERRKQNQAIAQATATAIAVATARENEFQQELSYFYTQGVTAFNSGEWWDAAFNLKQVVELDPDFQDAQHKLDEARSKIGSIGYIDNITKTIYVANADGGNPAPIINLPDMINTSHRFISWSADESRFAATLNGSTILLMDASGANKQTLELEASRIYDLSQSSDGSIIAVGGQDGLFIINRQTNSYTHPTCNRWDWINALALSPDGRMLLYFDINDHDLHIVDVKSGSCSQFPVESDGVSTIAWSPDGTRIAFEDHGIWISQSDGSGQIKIYEPFSNARCITWSPDSRKLAFSNNYGIFVINADFVGEAKNIAENTSDFDPECPTWFIAE